MKPLAETLLEHIAQSGENLHVLAQKTGVDYGTLYRFANQGRNLQMHVVQRLCDYFRLELRPAESSPPRSERRTPKGRGTATRGSGRGRTPKTKG